MTFKHPVPDAIVKVREEIETTVGDGERVIDVLRRLGFEMVFRYEKYREEFASPDVIIALDETPVGTFVELEGSHAGIMAAAAGLGRTSADFILDSYRTLFVQACAADGVVATDMLFVGPSGPTT